MAVEVITRSSRRVETSPGMFGAKPRPVDPHYNWEHERLAVRAQAQEILPKMTRPYGRAASLHRFEAKYPRDEQSFDYAVLRKPANLQIAGIIEDSEHALVQSFANKGGEPQSEMDDQNPGKILHQWQNGFTPHWRNQELADAGFPYVVHSNGTIEIKYYGAGDTTPGTIVDLAVIARAKTRLASSSVVTARRALEQTIGSFWSDAKIAYNHQITYADKDQDGLVEDNPRDLNLLENQTERDAGNTYVLENGKKTPYPHRNLHNNSVNLAAMREMVWMAKIAGEPNLAKDAQERFDIGLKAYREGFFMPEEGYMSPLLYGDSKTQAKILTSEAMEALYWRLVNQPMADQIAYRYLREDFTTNFGQRSRSDKSSFFYINGPDSYWSGSVWLHDNARAADGLQNYGKFREARKQDEKLFKVAYLLGPVELFAVNRRGQLRPYQEESGKPVAGNPQLFALGGILGRSAEYEQPDTQYMKWYQNYQEAIKAA